MIDKIYYCLASISLLLYCFKECYDYKKNKHKDYIKVNSIECDLDEVFDDYSLYNDNDENLNDENLNDKNLNDEKFIKKDNYVINMN